MVVLVVNHIALLYCVIRLNWSPLLTCKPVAIVDGELVQSCTNYSFLLPLMAAVLEAIGLGPILHYSGVLRWGFNRRRHRW